MSWKYAMVKVDFEWWPEVEDSINPVCILAEVYDDGDGKYTSWCYAHPSNPQELEMAYQDVRRDGVNEWFYKNGTFNRCPRTEKWRFTLTSEDQSTNPPADPELKQ